MDAFCLRVFPECVVGKNPNTPNLSPHGWRRRNGGIRGLWSPGCISVVRTQNYGNHPLTVSLLVTSSYNVMSLHSLCQGSFATCAFLIHEGNYLSQKYAVKKANHAMWHHIQTGDKKFISKHTYVGTQDICRARDFMQLHILRSNSPFCLVYFDSPFWNQYNSKNQNNMSTHLTIKNENRPNPRTATPERKRVYCLWIKKWTLHS